MKVINSKVILTTLVVMCIIGFCSVPYLKGACNYGNYQDLHLKVTTGNDQCPVSELRTFSCTVYDAGNQRMGFNDQLDDNMENYEWDKESPHLEEVSQFYNKYKVRGAVPKDDWVWVNCRIVAEGWSGGCIGYDYIHVVPLITD